MNVYGLLISIALYFGIDSFQKTSIKFFKSSKQQDIFIFSTVLIGILGARLYHVIDYWSFYSKNPIQIINFPAGGLGILGAIILSFIYIYFYCHINHISLIKIINIITPLLAIGQSIGRIGNYFNTEVFGIPTYIDIGQYIPIDKRPVNFVQFSFFHPIWLYESVLLFITYLLIKKSKSPFYLYLVLYGLIRFLLEFLRFDTWSIGPTKVGQIISLIMILIGTVLLTFKNHHSKRSI